MSIASFRKKIQKIDPTADIMQGHGYFFFTGDSVEYAYTTSVCTHKFKNLPEETWMNIFKDFQVQSARRK